tara:strand:- start:2844 stop:3248 length:405 start_codon:yes stop_codon:yes gene_type:complete
MGQTPSQQAPAKVPLTYQWYSGEMPKTCHMPLDENTHRVVDGIPCLYDRQRNGGGEWTNALPTDEFFTSGDLLIRTTVSEYGETRHVVAVRQGNVEYRMSGDPAYPEIHVVPSGPTFKTIDAALSSQGESKLRM